MDYEIPCECWSAYHHRLVRDGWSLTDRQRVAKQERCDIFEKSVGRGWTLRKIAHAETDAPTGKASQWDEHELVGPAGNQTISCPTWEWADVDNQPLVWAACGKLYAAGIHREGLGDEVELCDFNDMTFEAIEAPY